MAITNGYCTLAELRARLGITDASDLADDSILEATIEAASRAIDSFTGRQFYATSATRYFSAEDADCLFIPDLLTVTTLKTDGDGDRTFETTWATTDYDLLPFNDSPKTRIELAPNGNNTFPTHAKGVEIVGSWGYSSTTPDMINEACLIQAARLYKRKDAPFGVLGTPETGVARIPRVDMDVMQLIEPFRRIQMAGA
jgi:hypothetical protein